MRRSLPALLLYAAYAHSQGIQVAEGSSYTDEQTPTLTWKGSLTRSEVNTELVNAQHEGTIPTGEAADYPRLKFTPMQGQLPVEQQFEQSVVKAPPTTIDGYRFVGGEAGYVRP